MKSVRGKPHGHKQQLLLLDAKAKNNNLPTAAPTCFSPQYKKSDAFIGVVTYLLRWNSI